MLSLGLATKISWSGLGKCMVWLKIAKLAEYGPFSLNNSRKKLSGTGPPPHETS